MIIGSPSLIVCGSARHDSKFEFSLSVLEAPYSIICVGGMNPYPLAVSAATVAMFVVWCRISAVGNGGGMLCQ